VQNIWKGISLLIPTGSSVSTNGHGANGGSSLAQRSAVGSHFGQQSTNGLLLSLKYGNDGQTLAIASDALVWDYPFQLGRKDNKPIKVRIFVVMQWCYYFYCCCARIMILLTPHSFCASMGLTSLCSLPSVPVDMVSDIG
jgi:hypothetical protein